MQKELSAFRLTEELSLNVKQFYASFGAMQTHNALTARVMQTSFALTAEELLLTVYNNLKQGAYKMVTLTEKESENVFFDSLISQATLFPAMESRDAVKLAFQEAFGGEHLVSDPKASEERIQSEIGSFEEVSGKQAFSYVGKHTARLSLDSPIVRGLPAEMINRLFLASAELTDKLYGKREEREARFKSYLDICEKAAENNLVPFSKEDFLSFKNEYLQNGLHPVSHSDTYRSTYKPSYRVISSAFVPLFPAIVRINELLKEDKKCITAGIDGRAASGKTTAAQLLSAVFDSEIIHMDDFFLPLNLRTPERFAEKGGNIHYERFLQEVVPNLSKEDAFTYRVFDCSRMDYGESRTILSASQKPLRIVEGTYSHHPLYNNIYDVKIMMSISPETQKQRILRRNGEKMWTMFRDRWIPLEENYFKK